MAFWYLDALIKGQITCTNPATCTHTHQKVQCPGQQIHTKFLEPLLGTKLHSLQIFPTTKWVITADVYIFLCNQFLSHAKCLYNWYVTNSFKEEKRSRYYIAWRIQASYRSQKGVGRRGIFGRAIYDKTCCVEKAINAISNITDWMYRYLPFSKL